jgi:hypothetical protein
MSGTCFFRKTGTVSPLSPMGLDIAEIDEAWESVLIRLDDVEVVDPDPQNAPLQWQVTEGTGSININYTGCAYVKVFVGDTFDSIAGHVLHSTNYLVRPRDAGDFAGYFTSTPDTAIPVDTACSE